MGKMVFVPLTDDLLYEHPERILGPVIPFSQRARRAPADSDMSSSTTPGLNTKTKLEAPSRISARRSKQNNHSFLHVDSLR